MALCRSGLRLCFIGCPMTAVSLVAAENVILIFSGVPQEAQVPQCTRLLFFRKFGLYTLVRLLNCASTPLEMRYLIDALLHTEALYQQAHHAARSCSG